MTKKTAYIILEDKSLIIEYYGGAFSVDELIEFKKTVASDKNYNPNFNIIHDFRKIEFLFEIEEVAKYVDLISQNKKYLGKRKSTMITETPNQVITSISFQTLKKELPIKMKICSSFAAAFNFIGLSFSDWEFIESQIDKLKNAS